MAIMIQRIFMKYAITNHIVLKQISYRIQWCNFHSNRSTFEKVIAKIERGPYFMHHGVDSWADRLCSVFSADGWLDSSGRQFASTTTTSSAHSVIRVTLASTDYLKGVNTRVTLYLAVSIQESRAVAGIPRDEAAIFQDGGRLPSWIWSNGE